MIGCTIATRTWRHHAFARLSGGDAASQNYTERGYVVLDEADRTASLSRFVVLGRLRKWVKYDCLAVLGGAFSGVS